MLKHRQVYISLKLEFLYYFQEFSGDHSHVTNLELVLHLCTLCHLICTSRDLFLSCCCETSPWHTRPDVQTRPGGHKRPITAATLLCSSETSSKPNCCASQKHKSCSEHEGKFHDLSGAFGKSLVENHLVVI